MRAYLAGLCTNTQERDKRMRIDFRLKRALWPTITYHSWLLGAQHCLP